MGLTVSHASSLTNADNPLYAIKPSDWNSSHIFTLNAVGSEVSGAFGNGGGVSFGLSADGKVTAAAPAGAPSPINFSAGTTSSNIGSVVFSDSNGLAFGLNGSTITGSYTQSTHAHTAWPLGFSAGTQTATSGTPGLANSNNFTFGMSGSSQITASFSESTHAHSQYSFSNLNGVTFGTAGSTVTASVQTNYAGVGETVGTIAGTDLALTVNTDGVSIGYAKWITTGALSGDTTKYAGVGETVGTIAGTDIAITMNTDGLSLGYPKAITTARASTDAIGLNTAQTNVTWTVNSSGLSLNAGGYAGTASGFTGAGVSGTLTYNTVGLSLSLSVPATSSLVGTSGVSISTAGSTISVYPKALSAWDPYPIITGTGSSSHAPASVWFSKMNLDWPVAVSFANVFKSLNVSAPGMSSQNSSLTNKFSYSHGLTIFTRQDFAGNSTNMSQWTTASFGMTGSISQSSSSASVALSWVTNSTGGTTSFSTASASNLWTNFFTGQQMFRIPLVTTMTPGEYFIGQQHSSTTATVGSNFTLLSVSNIHVVPQSLTIATITSSGSLGASSPDGLGIGVASAVTTNNTMALSVISAATQNWWYMNFSNV